MLLLPGVLLRHLQLDGQPRLRHRGDHGGDGLAGLEVQRAVLDLQDHVVVEPAVQRREVVVRRPCAVGGPVAPVLVVVVDERAPEHGAAERAQRPGQQVRAVGVVAAVRERARLPLGVGLDDEAAEVGDGRVDAGGRVDAHHSCTSGSSGSAVASPPTVRGAAKLTDRYTRMPCGRNTSASRATSSRWSVSSRASAACTLTLFSPTALIPTDPSSRAYCATRDRSSRTRPSAQKIESPAYPRSTWPMTGWTTVLSQWSSMRIVVDRSVPRQLVVVGGEGGLPASDQVVQPVEQAGGAVGQHHGDAVDPPDGRNSRGRWCVHRRITYRSPRTAAIAGRYGSCRSGTPGRGTGRVAALPARATLGTMASTTSCDCATSAVTGSASVVVVRLPPNRAVAAATSATTVSATGPSSGPTATSTRREPSARNASSGSHIGCAGLVAARSPVVHRAVLEPVERQVRRLVREPRGRVVVVGDAETVLANRGAGSRPRT